MLQTAPYFKRDALTGLFPYERIGQIEWHLYLLDTSSLPEEYTRW